MAIEEGKPDIVKEKSDKVQDLYETILLKKLKKPYDRMPSVDDKERPLNQED